MTILSGSTIEAIVTEEKKMLMDGAIDYLLNFVIEESGRASLSGALIESPMAQGVESKGLISHGRTGGVRRERGLSIENLKKENLDVMTLDLRVGEEVYFSKVFGNFYKDELKRVKPESDGRIILRPNEEGDNVYYIPSYERIITPEHLELISDSKSTTGRTGIMSTNVKDLLEERGKESGIIWIASQPFAFPIIITPGKTSLAHLVFRIKNSPYLTNKEIEELGEELQMFYGEESINTKEMMASRGLTMNYSTKRIFRAKKYDEVMEPIDMDAPKRSIKWEDYFDYEEKKNGGRLKIDKKTFYLLGTKERIKLGRIAARIDREAYESGTGFWNHFAGWVNPGDDLEITAECYSMINRNIEEGMPMGSVLIDKIEEGVEIKGSDYKGQRAPEPPKMMDWKRRTD